MPEPALVNCPHCNGEVDVDADAEKGETFRCPHCSQDFMLPPAEEAPRDRDEQLSALKIRQLTSLRRSIIRSRSFAIIGMVMSAVGGAEFLWWAIQEYKS